MSEFVGKTVGHNQIVEEIGRGGMAVVYKAYQPSIDRYVAIKVMSRHLAQDASFTQRFQHEAKAIAGLEHPHILPLYDFGTTDGQMYMVMRYIEGGTVEGLVGQPLAYSRIVQIVGDIAKALDYAHRQGVIHRDIKPSNILVDQNGSVLLADFGIAKLVKGSQLTIPGAALGTLTYMAPEQVKGRVDQRSDIYSLGLVLYELLTGRSLAQGNKNLAEMLLHAIEPPPPPRKIKPDIPPALEGVVLKAIAQEPARRYQSGAEMAQALQEALAEVQAKPQPDTPASKSKMGPLLVGGLVLSLLLCLAGAGLIGGVLIGWPGSEPVTTVSPTRAPAEAAQTAPTSTPVQPATSPSPPPTATPLQSRGETLPVASSGEILFEERFASNQRDWFTGVSEDEYGRATVDFVDGRYRFAQEAKQGVFSWQELEGPPFADFELTVDAYPITHTAAFAYGVVFRSDGAGNFYTFEVDSDGYFIASLSRGDSWETLIEFTEMPAIQDDFNQLGVKAVGSSLSFFVNGQQAATIEDTSLSRGAIGVSVELYNEGDEATVEFDNLVVRAVDPDEGTPADSDILFVERFDSDANGWATGEFEDDYNWDSVTIEDGQYNFAVISKQDTVYVEKTLPRLEFSDFVLTVEAAPQNTDTFYSYGVAFRQNEMFHTYAFEIGNDGLYGFLLFDGQWNKLKDWSSTDAINVGETNRIKIIARGNQFTFFVNDQQLTTVEDDTLSSGKISLTIHTFEADKRAAVNFDNLVIRTVEPEP